MVVKIIRIHLFKKYDEKNKLFNVAGFNAPFTHEL